MQTRHALFSVYHAGPGAVNFEFCNSHVVFLKYTGKSPQNSRNIKMKQESYKITIYFPAGKGYNLT